MYKNPKWSAPNNMLIDIEIQQPNGEWWTFSASANDVEAKGRELFARAVAGEFGEIDEWDGMGYDEPEPDPPYVDPNESIPVSTP